MEEENKVVEEQPKQEEPKKEEGGMSQESKNALMAFIFSVVGFGFAWGWWVALIGSALGIVGLVFINKNEKEAEKQPFKTFGKIAKPLAIADIIIGAVMFTTALLVTIITAIIAAVNA